MSTPFKTRVIPALAAVSGLALLTACGGSTDSDASSSTSASSTSTSSSASSTGTAKSAKTSTSVDIPQTWSSTVDAKKIPLGDNKTLTTGAKKGYIYSCMAGDPNAGGAQHNGPWIDTANKTWDKSSKLSVKGKHTWPAAYYTEKTSGDNRVIKAGGLPTHQATGTFPIASDDPAYQYDFNSNKITKTALTYTLPLNPTVSSKGPACMRGEAGVLKNGVALYDGIDLQGRDAAAHELQDLCDGHPDGTDEYHYHDMPSCILSATTGKSKSVLVGYALDGFGIYVERDSKGNLPTNADLDECHGRTSTVVWNGKKTKIYHYSASMEFPYTVGCFKGATLARPTKGSQNGGN